MLSTPAMRKSLLALAALLASSSALADTLVSNVNGIQVDDKGRLQHFKALIVTDDGKVRMTIEHPELVRIAGITNTVDGGGKTLLPGLIDAHGHIMGLGFAAIQLDLTGTTSVDDLGQRIAFQHWRPDDGAPDSLRGGADIVDCRAGLGRSVHGRTA